MSPSADDEALRSGSPAACVIEPDAVVCAHAVQMPTVHHLAAWTPEIMSVEIHRLAPAIRVKVRGNAVTVTLFRYIAAPEIELNGPTARTPAAASTAALQLPRSHRFPMGASKIVAVEVNGLTITIIVVMGRPPPTLTVTHWGIATCVPEIDGPVPTAPTKLPP